MTKRILIASDPLMTHEREQISNNRWLFDLLHRPIERATRVKPELWASSTDGDNTLCRKKFFELSDITLNSEETQFWFDVDRISQASKDYLSQFVEPTDLVIGYEMSAQTRQLLNEFGVQYVDIWLHPVRFMDDVLFAFNSNSVDIRKHIFNYDVPEEKMFLHADRVKIQTYKGWRRVEADILENSALFVGQMLNDKSVCQDGHMLNLLDFQARVEEIAEKHSRIYYARHPYLRGGDEHIMQFVKSHPKMEMAQQPTYRMLSSENLTKVFGVSSSVITEAKYFDKDAEHLFRPVFGYGDITDKSHYATVYQSFVSPHFWSDILRFAFHTYPSPEIMFDDPKDKIRDMLGFYWSYADIDKNEHVRQRVNKIGATSKPRPTSVVQKKPIAKSPAKPVGFYQTDAQMAQLFKSIDSHKVISFDIFDTLIERLVDQPGEIHPMMQTAALQITDGKITDFVKARREARNLALSRANGEEVLLRDRYKAMAEHYGLTQEQGEQLHQLELSIELAVCQPRFAGVEALCHAVRSGKRVILVSDIFFERDFIKALLGNCNITGWDKIYLSSEEGVLKQTGRLFDAVLASEKKNPAQFLHIGDNAKADITMGKSRGLDVFYLPDKRSISNAASTSVKAWSGIKDGHTRSLVSGLTSRAYTGTTLPDLPGCSKGSPDFLGYGIAGPMFWGFSNWIAQNAKQQGLTDIYFLARDGDIAKKCYDIITCGDDTAPRSHYLLASRRSVSVASISSLDDILLNLKKNFTPCSFRSLFMNRFGLDAEKITVQAFEDSGYKSPDDIANWGRDHEKIVRLFSRSDVMAEIIKNANVEHDLLTQYYSDAGLGDDDRKIGFVDIGHSGSLQAAITNIMSIDVSTGFYFATKSDIDDTIGANHRSMGYAVDRIKHDDAAHPYQKHILMFELLFQNKDGSFLCFENGPNGPTPTFIEMESEARRVSFIKNVHAGAVRFTEDIQKIKTKLDLHLELEGSEAILAYSQMLRLPSPTDVEMFKGIGFENKYSSRDIRWLVATGKNSSEPSLWLEGAAAIQKPVAMPRVRRKFIKLGMITPFVRKERLRNKLLRDPEAFFADSKNPIVRLIGKTAA